MKKIYLAALTLAMTACVSNEDLNPVDNYGYIDVNVSNDPVMVTRDIQSVGDLTLWTIKTKFGEEDMQDWAVDKAYKEGNYTVYVQNYADDDAWKEANEKYGAAFYKGDTEVKVEAGKTNEATIDCGRAKNAKLTVTIADMPSAFTDVKLIAKRDSENSLEFSESNKKTEAFFGNDETVNYSIYYTYNQENKEILNQQITMKGAATDNVITISANDNGLISVTITYDDSFEKGNSGTIQFDAATGEKVETSSQGE